MIDNAYARGQQLLCGDYSQYTPTGKSYFVKKGRWFTVPKRGDVVYFYYSSLGRVGHVAGAVVVEADYEKENLSLLQSKVIHQEVPGTGTEDALLNIHIQNLLIM